VAFDEISRSYDAVADAYEKRFLDELRGKPRDREWLDRFAAAVGCVILDVGCGPGQVGAYLRNQGRTVIGVDGSAAMTRLATGRLNAAVVADMRSLPFAANVVYGIAAFYSVIHLQRTDRRRAFEEFSRALRPSGHLLVTAQEGDGDVDVREFLGEPVPLTAAFWLLDDLIATAHSVGFSVLHAARYEPYLSEGSSFRLFLHAVRS
jgi:SAM-dependent methyltransferase